MWYKERTQEEKIIPIVYLLFIGKKEFMPPFIPDHDPQFEDEYEFTYLDEDIKPIMISVNKEWLEEGPFYPFLKKIYEDFKSW